MADESAKIDANQKKTLLGVTNAATPELRQIKVDATTSRLLCSATVSGVSSVTVANEATDTTCFPLFVTAATGSLGPKTNAGLTFNSNSGLLGAVALKSNSSITLGVAGGTTGSIILNGTTSGVVTLKVADVAGTYTLTLPTTDGDANQLLKTDGSGNLSWTDPASGGASTALDNLASVAINTSLISDTTNTDDLGSSTKLWKDLFVTNIGATATRVTKGWFTDIESTNMPTVGGVAILTSLTAPQFTTIELGHASDTTISRSAAGVLAVEGTAIPKGTGTENEIAYWSGTNTLGTLATATYPSLTELSYVKGVTSAIQTQIGNKANSASPTFTGTVTLPKTLEIQDTSADHQYVLAVSELTADRTITLPLLTGTDTFVFQAHTQTLTNKRITERVTTTTDDATAVIDIDTCDTYQLSAIANNTEFTLTGTPTDGQKLIVRLKDAGAAKNLTWTGFTAVGITLPTVTVAGKWMYIGCIYNSAASAWHAVAYSLQA